MKLVVLGGGGVRSPFLAKSIASNAQETGIKEIVFVDNDKTKLDIFGKISQKVAFIINNNINFSITTDAQSALTDADFIITTLRVGQDESRVDDEKIALKYGLVGQETTGSGGFGMAIRSVPILIEYCKLIQQVSKPNALVFNFTNPSGIITQALRNEGFNNVYGICDAPSEFIKQLVTLLNIDPKQFSIKCFGLNHLSWFKDATVDGKNVMKDILSHPNLYVDTEMRLFEPNLIEIMGNVLPNEYLYFYYYRDSAIKSILKSGKTRGETIYEINKAMLEELKQVNIEEDAERAFEIFMTYYLMRENSYFSIESGQQRPKQISVPSLKDFIEKPDDGGYSGVALNFIKAYTQGEEVEMILSIPNDGAIKGLRDEDVVEISCRISKSKIIPNKVVDVNDIHLNLINTIKTYENYTIDAIKNKSRNLAIKALTFHPLINSYELANNLVNDYLECHKEYIGVWE